MVPRFWRKIKYRYEVVGSYCENCESYFYPHRELCPRCRRKGVVNDIKLPDKGKVLSYTNVNGKTIALVELENSIRMIAEIRGNVKVGTKVRKVFRRYGEDGEDGIIYYGTKFVPIDNATKDL
ncbi:MAG: Zn-ribbon domain-containing OB-fold protein [Archaeoglobaceae archaeon]